MQHDMPGKGGAATPNNLNLAGTVPFVGSRRGLDDSGYVRYPITLDAHGRVWAGSGKDRRCLFQIASSIAVFRMPPESDGAIGTVEVQNNRIVLTLHLAE